MHSYNACMYFPSPLRGPGSQEHRAPRKGARLLGETADARAGQGLPRVGLERPEVPEPEEALKP